LLTSAFLVLARQQSPLPAWIGSAQTSRPASRHGVSVFGDLKYLAGFEQFDYVNATVPKGGTARQIALGTCDNFNMVVDGAKGALAVGAAGGGA
jgi:microcin C transport system substrate-binding protein